MNILINDNHAITALGIKLIIEKNFKNAEISLAKSQDEVLDLISKNNYDVIILGNTDALEVMKQMFKKIKKHQDDAKILICAENQNIVYEIPLLNMGSSGIIYKSSSEQDFVLAINVVMAGFVFASQDVFEQNSTNGHNMLIETPSKKLSNRELDVFKLLTQGESVKNISKNLELHQSTVSTLKKRVMTKLGVDNIVELSKVAQHQDTSFLV